MKNSNGPFDLEAARATALSIALDSRCGAPEELVTLLREAQTQGVLRLAMAALEAYLGIQHEKLAEGFVRLGRVTEAARMRVAAARAQMAWRKAQAELKGEQ